MKTAALTVTTPSERELVMTREFAAPRGMVFDALTKPELVQRWLLGPPGWTMPVCDIDVRAGGVTGYGSRHRTTCQRSDRGLTPLSSRPTVPAGTASREPGRATVTNPLAL